MTDGERNVLLIVLTGLLGALLIAAAFMAGPMELTKQFRIVLPIVGVLGFGTIFGFFVYPYIPSKSKDELRAEAEAKKEDKFAPKREDLEMTDQQITAEIKKSRAEEEVVRKKIEAVKEQLEAAQKQRQAKATQSAAKPEPKPSEAKAVSSVKSEPKSETKGETNKNIREEKVTVPVPKAKPTESKVESAVSQPKPTPKPETKPEPKPERPAAQVVKIEPKTAAPK